MATASPEMLSFAVYTVPEALRKEKEKDCTVLSASSSSQCDRANYIHSTALPLSNLLQGCETVLGVFRADNLSETPYDLLVGHLLLALVSFGDVAGVGGALGPRGAGVWRGLGRGLLWRLGPRRFGDGLCIGGTRGRWRRRRRLCCEWGGPIWLGARGKHGSVPVCRARKTHLGLFRFCMRRALDNWRRLLWWRLAILGPGKRCPVVSRCGGKKWLCAGTIAHVTRPAHLTARFHLWPRPSCRGLFHRHEFR